MSVDKKVKGKGGVIYKPKGRAGEYALLACNIYSGCTHGCDYCYVPGTLHIPKEIFHSKVMLRQGILGRLRTDARALSGTDRRVLVCFSCDPYPPPEYEIGTTRQILKILRKHQIPFQILTKGGMRAVRDFDCYGPNDAFATTLTLTDPRESMRFEPNAPLPADRIKAIQEAKEKGIQTWVSLEPVINPQQSLWLIEMTHGFVDHYKIGKLNHQASDIDWRAFGARAIELCEKYNVSCYIKADLARHLDGIEFTNTDTRRIGTDSCLTRYSSGIG